MLDDRCIAFVEKRYAEFLGEQTTFHRRIFGQHVRCRHKLMTQGLAEVIAQLDVLVLAGDQRQIVAQQIGVRIVDLQKNRDDMRLECQLSLPLGNQSPDRTVLGSKNKRQVQRKEFAPHYSDSSQEALGFHKSSSRSGCQRYFCMSILPSRMTTSSMISRLDCRL